MATINQKKKNEIKKFAFVFNSPNFENKNTVKQKPKLQLHMQIKKNSF